MKYRSYYINVDEVSWITFKNYYKMRWNYYKLWQLSLLQSAMDSYYKLRQLFYYKVRHGLLQIATGITKCDDYYKLRQYSLSLILWPKWGPKGRKKVFGDPSPPPLSQGTPPPPLHVSQVWIRHCIQLICYSSKGIFNVVELVVADIDLGVMQIFL